MKVIDIWACFVLVSTLPLKLVIQESGSWQGFEAWERQRIRFIHVFTWIERSIGMYVQHKRVTFQEGQIKNFIIYNMLIPKNILKYFYMNSFWPINGLLRPWSWPHTHSDIEAPTYHRYSLDILTNTMIISWIVMVPKIGIGKSIVRVIQYNFMVFTENTAKMDVAYQKITSVFWPRKY